MRKANWARGHPEDGRQKRLGGKTMKRSAKIAAAICAAAVLGAGTGMSYAYLTAQDDASNVLDVSGVTVTVEENFNPPSEVKPGTVITKSPKVVSSDSDVDCYVRARVTFTDDMEAKCEPLSINSGWTLGSDGYYYWQGKLSPGASTSTIFDQIKVKDSAAEWEVVPFEVDVYAEAVQCGSLSADAAWAAMD